MAPSGVRLCASLLLLNLKHRERAEAIRAEAHDDSRFQVPGFGMEGFGGGRAFALSVLGLGFRAFVK